MMPCRGNSRLPLLLSLLLLLLLLQDALLATSGSSIAHPKVLVNNALESTNRTSVFVKQIPPMKLENCVEDDSWKDPIEYGGGWEEDEDSEDWGDCGEWEDEEEDEEEGYEYYYYYYERDLAHEEGFCSEGSRTVPIEDDCYWKHGLEDQWTVVDQIDEKYLVYETYLEVLAEKYGPNWEEKYELVGDEELIYEYYLDFLKQNADKEAAEEQLMRLLVFSYVKTNNIKQAHSSMHSPCVCYPTIIKDFAATDLFFQTSRNVISYKYPRGHYQALIVSHLVCL